MWNLFHLFSVQITLLWSSAVSLSYTMNCGVKELLCWAIVIITGVQWHQVSSCPTFNLLMSFNSFLFDEGTLVRRLATYCLYSVCALAPWGGISYQQHCTVSPVVLTSCGSPEVDASGSVSVFLHTPCGLWRRCVFFQHARSVQFKF